MTNSFSLNFQLNNAGRRKLLTRHPLFVTEIWQAQLTQFEGELGGWARVVESLRAASPEPAGRTNRSGWNSQDNAVLDNPCFEQLAPIVQQIISDVIAEMAGRALPFVLQSWVNMHDRGGFNFLHMHDNVLLSGVFYIRVPPGSGALVFRDPRPGVLGSPYKGNGPNACKEVRLTARAGLLVLFPHWLEHYVEPHGNDETRIAIAMNALRG